MQSTPPSKCPTPFDPKQVRWDVISNWSACQAPVSSQIWGGRSRSNPEPEWRLPTAFLFGYSGSLRLGGTDMTGPAGDVDRLVAELRVDVGHHLNHLPRLHLRRFRVQ